ncbi:hypothetical protein M0805_003776 [Coniferiporia weirii]|nr:hypothetical protein M0805_003776 [Coniferiporia weirii]
MATVAVAVARPLPTVLQPAHPVTRPGRSRLVSFSDSSLSSPNTGDSWFHVPQAVSTDSSQSSHSSNPPLPKGARPPSPQSSRPAVPHGDPDPSRKRSTSLSSWKVEWRGFSKVVKWAVLGNRLEDGDRPHKHSTSEGTHYNSDVLAFGTSEVQRLDKPLPYDRDDTAYDPHICASPTSPLPSSVLVMSMDPTYDGDGPRLLRPQSELGHGVAPAHLGPQFPSASNASPQDDLVRRSGSPPTSRHGSHVQGASYTSVQRAASEQGCPWVHGSRFDMQNTFSDVNHSTTLHESTYYWPYPVRGALSDSGHTGDCGTMLRNTYMSALSSSNGHSAFLNDSDPNLRTSKSFRLAHSATALPLRKSLRSTLPPQIYPDRLPSHYPSGKHAPPSSPIPRSPFYAAVMTAPLTPPKPISKSPRKLTKKPSPALPPLPKVPKSEVPDVPPPVPPKPLTISKKKQASTVLPSASSQSSGHITALPALTDTSASTSHEGEPLSLSDSATSVRGPDDSQSSKRPSLLRTESNRRWTVAVADAPDDLFIEELERLRRMGLRAGDVHGIRNTRHQHVQSTNASTMEDAYGELPMHAISEGHLDINQLEKSKLAERNTVVIQEVDAEDESEWLCARRAILCCRELVRTERSYQARLQELVDGSVSDAVPTLLLQYVPALINASKVLSAHFNEDMSASGVSNAFVTVESTMENAFVAWSGVVGEFFIKRDSLSVTKLKREVASTAIITENNHHLVESGSSKVRCVSMHGHDESHVTPSVSATSRVSRAINTSSSIHWLFRPAFAHTPGDSNEEKESFPGLRKSFRLKELRVKEEKERRRRPPFRDLAILPTQRVTRYVLLYKDLLKHTPTSSPIRDLVERAVGSAVRLAQKCDRAQDNSSFLCHS